MLIPGSWLTRGRHPSPSVTQGVPIAVQVSRTGRIEGHTLSSVYLCIRTSFTSKQALTTQPAGWLIRRNMPPRAAHLLFFVLLAQRWPTLLALNITWIRPAAGDVYGPGSPIIGQWQSNEGILAPSFGLCNGQGEAGDLGASDEDDGDCGTAIQPTVTHDEDDDSYQVALYVLRPSFTSCMH